MILRLEGTEHLWTLTLYWRSCFLLGGGVPGPARGLTSVKLPGSPGPKEELSCSGFPLPAGITMEMKEVGAGARPRFFGPFALWPLASPRPQACYFPFLRGLGNVIPKLPGS